MLADRGQRLAEAQELIERALKIDPDNPAFLDSLGWALFKQGKTKEAEEPLRRAAVRLRGNSVIQDHFGDVLAALGRFDEATAAWRQALAGDGDSIDRDVVEKKIKDAQGRRRR
jgi:Flp pilus assembly protein TadD